ncbi:MAG: glycosyltransferase family 1 protein [Synechococcus sp.]|nr:glycosyltransferase family 1 protein [Synechococcus sp.]
MLLFNLSILSKKPTGISVYAKNISSHLDDLHIKFLANDWQEKDKFYKIPDGLSPDHGIKGHIRRLWWTQFSLPKIYKKLDASLILSPLPEMPLYTECRAIVMIHDLIPLRVAHKNSRLYYYYKFVLPKIIIQAKHIICNSQSTADEIIERFKIPCHRITPILLAYDNKHFRIIGDLGEPLKPYFLYIGRHDLHKNLPRVIYAFSRLPNCQDYEFWLVGPIDHRYTPELRRLVIDLGLEKQILFKDYVSYQNLPKIINQALCLIFPSLWEGFGLPILESMACGTPVITSCYSALPEVAGDAALFVDPQNIDNIVSSMLRIAREENLREQLITRGLNRVKEFSWEKTANNTRTVIENFL